MSEYVLNGTSAQLGFTLVYAGKYTTEDKLAMQTIQKLNTTQKKQTMQNTAKQNYSGLVAFYDTQPGNEVGLFYNASFRLKLKSNQFHRQYQKSRL